MTSVQVQEQVVVGTGVDGAVGWVRINPVHHMDMHLFKRQTLHAIASHIDNPLVHTIAVTDIQKVISPFVDIQQDHMFVEQLNELCREVLALISTASKTLVVRWSYPDETSRSAASMYREPLTKREKQVLTAVYEGLSAREIGKRLFISERTVETHIGNGYRKLGIRSRIELIKRATEFGF